MVTYLLRRALCIFAQHPGMESKRLEAEVPEDLIAGTWHEVWSGWCPVCKRTITWQVSGV